MCMLGAGGGGGISTCSPLHLWLYNVNTIPMFRPNDHALTEITFLGSADNDMRTD